MAKQVAEDSASVLCLLKVAHVLARSGFVSSAELEKAQVAQKVAEDRASNLSAALDISQEQLEKKSEEVKKLTEQAEAWTEEKKKMEEEFNALWALDEKEDADVKEMGSWAKLVAFMEELKSDSLEIGKAGFSLAIQQLQLVNSDLNTTGVDLCSKIVDGQLVPREEEEGDEEGEGGDEEVAP